MDDRFNAWLKENGLRQNAGMREAWNAAVAAERGGTKAAHWSCRSIFSIT
jgi:hypothetical protein